MNQYIRFPIKSYQRVKSTTCNHTSFIKERTSLQFFDSSFSKLAGNGNQHFARLFRKPPEPLLVLVSEFTYSPHYGFRRIP